jgi:drug/metabolite transporter (DMT)-like permease
MSPTERQHRLRVIIAFALVYVFWGSTYLGIKIAVEHIPPALMSGSRFLIAGLAMLAWCSWSGRRVRVSRQEALRLAVVGILLLTVANVILAWSEQWVATGLAALIVAITPLWFVVLETWVFRGDKLAGRGIAGLLLGIAGLVLLLWPKLSSGAVLHGAADAIAAVTLIGGSFSWALGSVLSKHWPSRLDPFSASGWQMVFAGSTNLLIAGAFREYRQADLAWQGITATAYLVVFGSWVGFSAYIWLLHHVPTPKVATYAYVNPVIAVFLGWIILHERVDAFIIGGTLIIVVAVALVTSAKVIRTKEGVAEEAQLPEVETTAD